MAKTGQASRARVASTQRSLVVLDVLAAEPSLGTNEIARRTGMAASTVSRQLGTLVEAGLVDRVETTGHYRLGLRLVELGTAVLARLDVRTVARPHLEDLVGLVGETATLSVPGDPHAVTVDVVRSPQYLQGASQLGRPSVAHATAAGKVMLAFTDRLPSPPLASYTERTITRLDDLRVELDRIRKRGFADAYEEREQGLNAIAAPVWASDHSLAGIVALQGPVPRFGKAPARTVLPLLLDRAAAISAELGSQSG